MANTSTVGRELSDSLQKTSDLVAFANKELADDALQRRKEYRALCELMERVLEAADIDEKFGTTLSGVASALGCRSASVAAVLLAMSELLEERSKLELHVHSRQQQIAQIDRLIHEAVCETAQVDAMAVKLSKQRAQEACGEEEKSRQTAALNSKGLEYQRRTAIARKAILRSGITTGLTHTEIQHQSENVLQIRAETEHIRDRTRAFSELPPDMVLADMKVGEVKKEALRLQKLLDTQLDEFSL
mmetsp:Transcript_5987/g.18027  ORF Transcript_5987/g.18027 Transcript_5987/m.18027 type:complete len:245 (+) Transcript_5987:113-847(+)